jgi:hypothetical protein
VIHLVWLTLVLLAGSSPVASACAEPQESLGRVGVELGGPREELRLSAGGVETLLHVSVEAGERRLLEVPFIARAGADLPAPVPHLLGTPPPADAELLPATVELPAAWTALPGGLRSRALPPVEQPLPVAGALRLAWLAASLLLVLALRRRPPAALFLGLVAGLGSFVLPLPHVPAIQVRVLEGDADSGRWLEVTGAEARLELPREFLGWVRRLPQVGEARLEVREEAGRLRSTFLAPGARVYALRERELHGPTRSDPGTTGFRRVWVRDAGGAWSAHGAWRSPAPLPPAGDQPEAPPGWLAAGLPQGRVVLVGELVGDDDDEGWLRLVGFE